MSHNQETPSHAAASHASPPGSTPSNPTSPLTPSSHPTSPDPASAHPAASHSTSAHQSSALEKEFELERVILFSDAVFAIAITLLVIDIKFPEIPESLKGVNISRLFRPTIFGFLAFLLSFFFIGRSWAIHLRLFRLLRKYDQRLINLNLIFLFFIVTFPFTASGISGHVREDFFLPFYLYLSNIAFVSICHFILCRYIIYGKTGLTTEGEEAEKKYIYMRSKYTALSMAAMFLLLVVAPQFLHDVGKDYLTYSSIVIAGMAAFINRKSRKYKPIPPTQQRRPAP
jgi:uncharacterized membrane protein